MTVKVAVIYYSATGTVHALAEAVAEGAAAAGARVRLRRVAELAPDTAIDQNPHWRRYADAAASIAEASVEDLAWAGAFAFGTPTRFGAPAAQLKQFIDQAGGLWREGRLADKPVTAFTSAFNRHGGSEATILSLAKRHSTRPGTRDGGWPRPRSGYSRAAESPMPRATGTPAAPRR